MKQTDNLKSLSFITHGFYDKTDTKLDLNPILMTQVHSADALFITQAPSEPPKVDALITQTPNLNLTVYTADCAPILLADRTTKMIAAIHAGWKGAFQGIIENTVLKMIQHGANIDTIHAGIGPHIQQQSFEIGPEIQALFPTTESSFFKDKDNKIFFSAFEYQPLRILNTFDKYGQKLGYRLINDYILVNEKNACVEYEYRISKEGEEDESFYASKIIGPYVIAYGVASQYLTEKGRYSDADIFQSRYLQGIKSRLAKKGSLKMPKRRWE